MGAGKKLDVGRASWRPARPPRIMCANKLYVGVVVRFRDRVWCLWMGAGCGWVGVVEGGCF